MMSDRSDFVHRCSLFRRQDKGASTFAWGFFKNLCIEALIEKSVRNPHEGSVLSPVAGDVDNNPAAARKTPPQKRACPGGECRGIVE